MSTSSCSSNNNVCHCAHLMPRSRISRQTAPAGPLTCLQVSISKNLLSPRFFLLCQPFANPHSFCPRLRDQSGKLFFHFKVTHLQEQGEQCRLLLVCCCHLSSQFKPLWSRSAQGFEEPRCRRFAWSADTARESKRTTTLTWTATYSFFHFTRIYDACKVVSTQRRHICSTGTSMA